MSRIRVAVIGGGRNTEHDISLASAASAIAALDPARYIVTALTIGRDGCWRTPAGGPLGFGSVSHALRGCDVVLPLVHGRRGEDGTLAALCELLAVRYVGSGVTAGAIAIDKHATKVLAGSVGVATAPGVVLTRATASGYVFEHPVVVKPVSGGSSVGVSLVTDADGLCRALELAFADDDRVLVEDVVAGREVDIAVVRRADGTMLVSPPLEIVVDGVFDHDAKYGGSAVFRIPAALRPTELLAIESAAERVYDVLGCSGVARVDFFVTASGVVLNEVNTTPGFTRLSQVPRMFAAAGIPYPELIDMLIDDALASPANACV